MMSHTKHVTTVTTGPEDQPLTVEVTPGLDSALGTTPILLKADRFEWQHGSPQVKVWGHRVARRSGRIGAYMWGHVPLADAPGTILAHLNRADGI